MNTFPPATVLIICTLSTVSLARPEHNAFLNRSVRSTSELVKQVQSDQVVLRRYEKHFKMSEPELLRYFQGLHVEPLKAERRYLVFNVDDHMLIRKRMLHLKHGMLVFADQTHHPVLKRSCGNPMTPYLPAIGKNSKALHTKTSPPASELKSTDDTNGLLAIRAPDDSVPIVDAPTLTEEPEDAMVPAPTPGIPSEDIPVVPPGVAAPGLLTPLEGSGFLSGLSGLGFVGALSWGLGADHGSGGNGNHPVPTPEPASYVVMAGGIGWAINKKRR